MKSKLTCGKEIFSPVWSSFLFNLNRIILRRLCHTGNPLLSLKKEQTQSGEMNTKDINASKQLKETNTKNCKHGFQERSSPKLWCFKEENLTSFCAVSVLRICGVPFFFAVSVAIATRVAPPPNFLQSQK